MARGKTLEALLLSLKRECRISSATSSGKDVDEYYKELLRRNQEMLYDDYDWPFMRLLKADARVQMQAGSRYYDFPDDLNVERIEKVWYQYNTQWCKLPYGVGPEEDCPAATVHRRKSVARHARFRPW